MFSNELPLWGAVVLALHLFLLLVLCAFGTHRLSMVLRWFKYRDDQPPVLSKFTTLPNITVQIPLYNERMVAVRIVDAVCGFDYPKEKLQIQIVDDSTDETFDIVSHRVKFYQDMGVNIQHVTRNNRAGYKAGALKEAMESATGEFIAIFDADFIPEPDLLMKTVDVFTDSRVGMVQYRWEHLNKHSNLLNETQAMMLDAHFSLEQTVRANSGMLLNFNGTAGMWRTKAIIDAGHWSADTLTEDLDLSYRAQLKGWKMHYLNDVVCYGELPSDINAFKSQQHRWAKGGIQVMLKMLKNVWKAPLKLSQKIESTFHLTNNLAYLIMLLDTLFLLLPSLWLRSVYQTDSMLWFDVPLLLLSSGGHLVYLVFGQIALKRPYLKAFCFIPLLVVTGIRLAFNNANAALEALKGLESEFVRTPKSGELDTNTRALQSNVDMKQKDNLSVAFYRAVPPKGAFFELLFAVIYCVVFTWAIDQELWPLLPFIMLIIIGFLYAAKQSFVGNLKLSK